MSRERVIAYVKENPKKAVAASSAVLAGSVLAIAAGADPEKVLGFLKSLALFIGG